jgi:uncharacterized protein YyaL (SSP411 family)
MSRSNHLITSTSPYLLQHAHNPIDWYPWGEQALTKAQQEDKPILLSIGYAACHWCHVMAKESFENKEVAAIMNAYFINIKVDREENPDVDQVAIEAVQAMGLPVGWPLHVFLMPNQQPFYGGTYFPTEIWKKLLTDIAIAFKNHRQKLANSSFYFTNTLQKHDIGNQLGLLKDLCFTSHTVQQIFQGIYQKLDHQHGGVQGSPKFFMPSITTFLLNYYRLTQDQTALDQANLTLTNMACGGVYDHIGGGFFRYATDEAWVIPHFEKMLYDNAQLLSLYAYAYMTTKNNLYKQVIIETIAFLEREILDDVGMFHSSLDADSQGIEGAFYTWKYEEIYDLLEEEVAIFTAHYNISVIGNWEKGRNILYKNPRLILDNPSQATIDKKLAKAKDLVYSARYATRPKPEVNEQIITSWNGMMLQALIDIHYALGDSHFLDLAIKNAIAIASCLIQHDKVVRIYNSGKQSINGYLEDYAWVAKAFISLYQATFEEKWLYQADKLVQYVLGHFLNTDDNLFYFTDVSESVWIKRTQEIFDQVMPSSNAVMADTLFSLGRLLQHEVYTIAAQKMLYRIASLLQREPLSMAHWANLYLLQLSNMPVVIIIGPSSTSWSRVIKQHYPDILLAGATQKSTIPWMTSYTMQDDKTTVYICDMSACYTPLYSLEETIAWLNSWRK